MYANLYVEKYSNGKLLLDFITECEFIFFKNNGDYSENMKLWQYEPTMLYFNNIEKLHITEGDIISIPMHELIRHKENINSFFFDRSEEKESPHTIFMSFSDGSWLEELFYTREAFKSNRLRKQLVSYIDGTWPQGTPCALNKMVDKINIEAVDVAQGSANIIYSKNALAIFDFGASIFASKSELSRIAYNALHRFDKTYKTLIISHWDCDHYNLLTVLDDDQLKQLCCVFFPSEVITLTSKQVVDRLRKNCRYIRTFKSPPAKKRGSIGIVPIITKRNYVLYIGEKSKDINKSGLALVIKSARDITILGADHSNKQIWEYIYPDIVSKYYDKLNIVVPHHGGDCGKINLSHLSCTPGIAAISVGKNTYKHPNQTTIDRYEKLKFNVKRTDWERKNITIEMK